MSQIILHNYYRSSASYRVRLALHFKNLEFEYRVVHLLKNGGENLRPEYRAINPMAQVPTLEHNGHKITQSMAIMMYLDSIESNPQLFSKHPARNARIIEISEIINSGIQPLQNFGVLKELDSRFKITPEQKNDWVNYFISKGLAAVEVILKTTAGKFCVGDELSAADCCLLPQIYAAKRFNVDISSFSHVRRISEYISTLPEAVKAAPENQIDFS
jgi:maleylacetoacetate isomerase